MSEDSVRGDEGLSEAKGAVLHREKVISRGLAAAMMGLSAFFAAGGIIGYATDPNAPVWTLLFMLVIAVAVAAVGLVKPVLRTTVTDHEVYALHGLRASRVGLAQITAVSVVPAVRQSLLGAEAVGPSFGTHAVMIEYRGDTGATKKLALSSNDAPALAAAIEGARAASKGTGVRVQTESSVANEQRPEESSERAGASEGGSATRPA